MDNFEKISIEWSEYIKYRANLRNYDIGKIEEILRYSKERYFDTITQRMIVVGKHEKRLVIVPYEKNEDSINPITIHATTRQQINFRLKNW